MLHQLVPTVLVPWAAVTAAATASGASWVGVGFVSATAFVASLGDSWHIMTARERQQAKGHAAL